MPFNPGALREAAASPGFDEPPPDGLYDSLFRDFDIFESRAGKMTLRLSWTVLSGQLRDHEWSHVQSLEEFNDQGEPNPALPITARIVETIGVDIDRVSAIDDSAYALNELRRQLDGFVNGTYEVEVRRRGAFVNTTPKRRLDGVQMQQASTPAPTMSSGQAYGHSPPQQRLANAITQGDVPESGGGGGGLNLSTEPVRRDLEVDPNVSDVPGAKPGEFEHPPQQGDVDPETGEPIPFAWEPPPLERRVVEHNPFGSDD